jgi:hypothetical protein
MMAKTSNSTSKTEIVGTDAWLAEAAELSRKCPTFWRSAVPKTISCKQDLAWKTSCCSVLVIPKERAISFDEVCHRHLLAYQRSDQIKNLPSPEQLLSGLLLLREAKLVVEEQRPSCTDSADKKLAISI